MFVRGFKLAAMLAASLNSMLLLAPFTPGFPLVKAEDANLSNWMGILNEANIISKVPLSRLSLPGTHDTMTYDLSETISEGGIDDYPELAKILNKFGSVPFVTDFIRSQAQTQVLNITEQLNSGLRFVDFRIMYTAGDWRCLHMLQTKRLASDYLKEIRAWLDAHPKEIIVIWLSKHGDNEAKGNDQFPKVSLAQKSAFWKSYTTILRPSSRYICRIRSTQHRRAHFLTETTVL